MWCEQATPEAAHLLVSIFHLQLIAYFYAFANAIAYFYDLANAIAYFYDFANADALGCASVCDKLVTESFSSFLPLHNSLFHPLTDSSAFCFHHIKRSYLQRFPSLFSGDGRRAQPAATARDRNPLEQVFKSQIYILPWF